MRFMASFNSQGVIILTLYQNASIIFVVAWYTNTKLRI